MHELSIAQNILKMVEEEARRNQVDQVIGVRIKAGETRGIVPQNLSLCFDFVTRGTLAERGKN